MSRMVEIRQGKLRGVEGTYADIYRGIPYAKPPVGELRFHAPEPPEPWEGIYAADTFSCICPQLGQEPGSFYEKEFYSDPAFMPPQNEDCLYLNIWTPKSEEPRREEDLCPVAVWFHGGGFINGFGSEIEFDGEAYAKRGIVLVTVNYRLGLLGYFAHPDLTARDGHSGNYGLLDQIAAIDWVRENIAAFGGNPDQITIFGQSAGGMSVRALISSPLMKGKVRGAILQSCGGYHSPLTAAGDAGVLESAAVQFLKEKNMTLEDLRQGKIILVTDDEDRENEGDMICSARFATTENVNFMAKYAKGLICTPMSEAVARRLGLEQMVKVNTDNHQTAFTVSIDHVDTSTGISAA